MRILTLLAVMAITAGQVWADEPTYGKIHYTNGSTDGGSLCFSTTLEKTYNAQTDFNGSGVSSGNDRIYTYTVTGNILTDGKVYVRAVPSFGYTVTGMTITVEPSAPSSTAEAPRRGAPGVASTIPVTPVEGHSGVYTFPMPTDGTNVTVTASFPVSTPINVDYLDATGTKKTAQAYVLDGAELYLGESDQEFWYVCNSAIDYRTQLRLYGDTHIILADDATMTISAGTQHAIESNGALTIYGQGGASGKLIAEATSGEGIYSKGDITIISADVSVTSTSSYAVHVNPGNITITDSKVTVNGGYHGIVATNVNNTTKGNITINGSQVTAIGGTHANDYGINAVGGDITIGWKNTTDFIKASCYFIEGSGNVKTADGKPFIAYTPAATANDSEKQAVLIQGNTTLDANAIAAIAGKVLRPATADDVTVSYMDWDDTEKMLVSKNTATDNVADNDIVYVLQGGGATTLPSGWYVAKDEVSYTGGLTLNGDAHLILADGCNMTVGTEDSPIGYETIDCSANMKIYSQSIGDDMGSLSANSSHNYCNALSVYDNLTINGGKVTVTSNNSNNARGIYNQNVITVNGGVVTATGNGPYVDQGIFTQGSITINGGQVIATSKSYYGISAYQDVIINGGQVTAIGTSEGHGIEAENITLGWTNATDFINASSYTIDGTGSVKTADGKRFIAYNMASADDISANCIIGSATGETTLNDTDLDNIAGKTLRPLDGYYVKDQAGLTFNGKTNDDGSAKPDFTITTDAGTANEVTTPYYIYKANTEQNPVSVVVNSTGHADDHMEINATTATAAITQTDAEASSHCFAMPAEDVTITGIKYYNYGVDYMDWDDTQKKHVEKTTDANTKVYILTGGGATDLPGGWYVVNNWNTDENVNSGIDAAYTGQLKFTGDANLILSDGSEMTVTPASDYAIYAEKCSLAIYGQSIDATTMGSLTASSSNRYCIYAYTNTDNANTGITINGGRLTATSTNNIGILARSNTGTATLAFNGGCVNASGTYSAINAYSPNGTAITTISGGQVTATATASNSYAIYAKRDGGGNGTATVILSLTKSSDYITANSYSATGSVKIPAGKALAYTDGTTTVLGNTDADYIFGAAGNATLASIAGQTLRMSKNMPVSAVNAQYAALYQEDGDWKVADADVKMYVPTGNIIKNGNAYEMELKEVTGGGIPNGVPVILSKEGGLGDIPVVGTSAAEANTIEANYNNAESEIEQQHKDENTVPALTLFATNTTETLAQQIINAASPKDDQGNVIEETKVDPNDYVVLGIVNGKLTTLSANQTAVPSSTQSVVVISKFDLLQMIRGTYAATNSNAPSIVIDLGDVTGISDIKHESLNIKSDDAWYSLDGRKISCKPTQKGIYVNGGYKVVIK